MTNYFFSILLLFHCLLSDAKIEVWGYKGSVFFNNTSIIEGQTLDSASVLKLPNSSSYVCLVDWNKFKLIELYGVGSYSFKKISESLSSAPVLPAITSSFQDKKNYMKVVGEVYRCRCVDSDPFALFPLMKVSECVNVFQDDSLLFIVQRKNEYKLRHQKYFFSVSNLFDDPLFENSIASDIDSIRLLPSYIQKWTPEKHILISVKVREMVTKEVRDKDGKVIGSKLESFDTNISNAICIQILTPEESKSRKQTLFEILKYDSPAYRLYAAIWAIQNKLIFTGADLLLKVEYSQYSGFNKYYEVYRDLYILK